MNVNWQLCRDKVDNVNWRRGATNVRRSIDRRYLQYFIIRILFLLLYFYFIIRIFREN